MTLGDTLAAIAALPDDAKITLSIEKRDLVRALERRDGGGPDIVDTEQASTTFGYTADRWRRWCKAGSIPGAWQDAAGGSWRMPRTSCEAFLHELRSRGTKPSHPAPVLNRERPRRGPRPTHPAASPSTIRGRVARGPRLLCEAPAPPQAG
jgi:hypothetical protein